MNGRIFIAPLGDFSDENSWVEIARVSDDGIQYPEATGAEEVMDLLGGFMLSYGSAEPVRTEPASAYAHGGMIAPATPVDPVEQIDRALAGLCPCGAQPVDGFVPYCSDDCRPSHLGIHTDPRESGEGATPMRWRPDLVTAADEVEMSEYTNRVVRDGLGYQVWLYPGAEQVQLRVDDNYRYVGADMDRAEYDRDEQASTAKWEALVREMGNSRSSEPLPDRDMSAAELLRWVRQNRPDGWRLRQPGVYASPPNWMSGYLGRQDHIHVAQPADDERSYVRLVTAAIQDFHDALCPTCRAERDQAENPQQRALRLRRERNTGPARAPRAPRRIDPSNGR